MLVCMHHKNECTICEKLLVSMAQEENVILFKKGQALLFRGIPSHGVYIIKTGKLKFSRIGTEGKEQIIRFGKSGDIVGYQSILSDKPIETNIIALTDIEACYISKDTILKRIKQDSKFTQELLTIACNELHEAGKIITILAQKTARERLAEVLLILSDTFGEDNDGYIDVILKREELANAVGTATETVIRLLSEFKHNCFVDLTGSKIKLVSERQLAVIGRVYDYKSPQGLD